MTVFRDYSYDYEWDRAYCYPDSNVLRNQLNIRAAEDLAAAEREITSIRLAAAKLQPIRGHFDLDHLQKIHKAVFGDIYTWAGELRHVNISKGNQFCLAMHLNAYAENLFRKLEKEHYLIDSRDAVPHRLAWYLSEINVLHPFREGNGRTQRLFIEYLATVAGYRVDFSKVSPREMIVASADSFACEYDAIYRMFDRIAMPIAKTEQKAAVRHFFGEKSKQMSWLLESE